MRGKDSVLGGEQVEIAVADEEETSWRAQEIPIDIVFQDDSIIVINKPAGLVVHPGAGNMDGTLANALLYQIPELEKIPRAGIVHRLDKETSGLLVVARTLEAQTHLVEQLQQRSVTRRYQAIVNGVMTAGGTIDKAIGRHPSQRLRMAVLETGQQAKQAITHYRVEQRFRAHNWINVQL
jgi:23S rRNA pseudouridine1911/1915/1917 synthase